MLSPRCADVAMLFNTVSGLVTPHTDWVFVLVHAPRSFHHLSVAHNHATATYCLHVSNLQLARMISRTALLLEIVASIQQSAEQHRWITSNPPLASFLHSDQQLLECRLHPRTIKKSNSSGLPSACLLAVHWPVHQPTRSFHI